MLSYTQYKPSGILADYIECYWTCRALPTAMAPLERLIPGGRIEMIFNFGHPMQFLIQDELSAGQSISDVHIMGQRNQIYYAKQNGDTNLLGIRFKPAGITAFTSLPVSDLLNKIIPGEHVLGYKMKEWEYRLAEKKTDTEKIDLLESLLMQSVKEITPEWASVSKAVNSIRSGSSLSVHTLCNEHASYYKKMERSFLKYIGYTPKYYYRITRFNRAIRQMQLSDKSLTAVCYDCDYFDQSHFIKDFRQFAGTTPKKFQSETHAIANFLIHGQAV